MTGSVQFRCPRFRPRRSPAPVPRPAFPRCVVLTALLGTLAAGPAWAARTGLSPVPPDTLTVLFTGETRGNIVPCACPKNPLGGLARRAGFLREAARNSQGSLLVLDAGGFMPEGEVPLRDDPDVARRYVRLLLRGLERAGIEATALDHGERASIARIAPAELSALGPALLDGDPPAPARIFRREGWKIAVLALEESLPDAEVIAAGTRARAEADLLIVLARADCFTGRRLARLSRAGLVLLSRGARPEAPLREEGAFLVGSGIDGREIGEIRLVRTADGRLDVAGFRLIPMNATVQADRILEKEVRDLVRDAGPGQVEVLSGNRE